MCSKRQWSSVTITALFASVSAHPADDSIVIAQESDKQIASFNIGASRCLLKDDQIRCVRLQAAAPSEHDAQSEPLATPPTVSPTVKEHTPFKSDRVTTVDVSD